MTKRKNYVNYRIMLLCVPMKMHDSDEISFSENISSFIFRAVQMKNAIILTHLTQTYRYKFVFYEAKYE